MSGRIILGLVVFLVIVSASTVATCVKKAPFPASAEDKPNEAMIHFPEIGETVYIRARTWGLAGNHQEIIIATSPIDNAHLEYFRDRQIIYLDSTELYYRKVGANLLEIRADVVEAVPLGFSSRIKVEQTIFPSNEAAKQFATNFEKDGYSKISVYSPKE